MVDRNDETIRFICEYTLKKQRMHIDRQKSFCYNSIIELDENFFLKLWVLIQ